MDMIDSIVLLWRSSSLSDETCFIFEIYLIVDHSKMLVYIKVLQKNFSALDWGLTK